jgi:hypothetical protein
METFYEDAAKLIYCKNEESSELVDSLVAKYGLSREAIYYRVRTYFGDKLRNLRDRFHEPGYEEFARNLLICETKEQLRALYPAISHKNWAGIYDRVMGVSTFGKARVAALDVLKVKDYNPSPHDNAAMLAAFRLGDASFDAERGAWRIEHCAKQQGWLETKVMLFREAFPFASETISETGRGNYRWYSRKVGETKYSTFGTRPKSELVEFLNPFGLWILFLDDGSYTSTSQQAVSFAVESLELGTLLVAKLDEFGFKFRVANEHVIVMTGAFDVRRFLRDICEPFSNLTPKCMRYKTSYKDIVQIGDCS